jgi:hypothetical protein
MRGCNLSLCGCNSSKDISIQPPSFVYYFYTPMHILFPTGVDPKTGKSQNRGRLINFSKLYENIKKK